MKRNITSVILCFVALVAMTASCTKFLTEEPKTFVSPQDYYNTEEEMASAVVGCYSGLSCILDGLVGFSMNANVLFEGLTGYYDRLGANGSNLKAMGFELPYDRTSEGINGNIWKGYYYSIENCNATIAAIESKDETCTVPQAKRNAFLGEAYFLRAYYYYRLVTAFGPVPYKTTPTSGVADSQLAPDTEDVIYDGIVADLLKAEEMLAGQALARPDGHAGLGATKALLAKVYLTMAGYPLQKKECYAKAYEKAKEVVASGAFTLFDDYAKLHDQAYENTGEIIFSLQRDADFAGNNMSYFLAPVEPSICANSSNGGAYVPTASFYASFDDADARKSAFFFSEYNGVAFERPHLFKYFNASSKCVDEGKDGLDYTLIRYADVLLTLAEAACAGGTTSDAAALDAYQLVHGRAFAGSVKPSQISADEVFKERIFEFCGESQNWFDMTRTHKAWNANTKTVVGMMGYSPDGHATVNGHAFTEDDVYLIYPTREVRYNPNLVRP